MFQHRRRFFRRRAGLLSGAHFLPERGSGGWNPQHSFLQAVLLSAAQFAGQPLLYRLLSCTQFRGAGVGIFRTVYGGRVVIGSTISVRCASRGKKKWLLSGAQFGLFSEGGRLLSTAQFARWVKFGYCYRQHISEFRLLSKRVRTGLLSSAHFRQWGCYRAHSFQTVEFWGCCYRRHISEKIHRTAHSRYCYSRHNSVFPGQSGCYPAHNSQKSVFLRRVLLWVVSLRTVCPAGAGVVIDGTIQGFFARVVIQRTFPRSRIFPSALLECCAHFSLFLFSRPGLLYSTLFKNPTKFSLPPFSCKKTFLPLLRSAHCCVLHICVGMLRTAPL